MIEKTKLFYIKNETGVAMTEEQLLLFTENTHPEYQPAGDSFALFQKEKDASYEINETQSKN